MKTPSDLPRETSFHSNAEIFAKIGTPQPRRRFLSVSLKALVFASLVYGGFSIESQAVEAAGESLFDGKSLKGWKRSEFSGGNEVKVENGVIKVDAGEEMSGFQIDGEFPKDHYEFQVESQRLSGLDFFCTITFPIRDRFLSLVVGGWGGSTVGLSSVDHQDASQNETSTQRQFTDKVWYRIRLKVDGELIQAWIDDTRVVNLDTKDKHLDLRPGEIEISRPFGISTFRTEAAFRNLRLKKLSHPNS